MSRLNWDKVRRNQPLERWATENPGLAREYQENANVGVGLPEEVSTVRTRFVANGTDCQATRPRRIFARCPDCDSDVLQENLIRHLRKVHHCPPHQEMLQPAAPIQDNAVVECPICQTTVLERRLHLHLEKAHKFIQRKVLPPVDSPKQKAPAAKMEPNSTPASLLNDFSRDQSAQIPCEFCTSLVGRRNYKKHLRKVHGVVNIAIPSQPITSESAAKRLR